MKIGVIDGSNYFKGLLLLVRKDRVVSEPEIELMKRIGKNLGFEKEFCENAINEILYNTHIDDTPSKFVSKNIAEKFIRDGLRLALSDSQMHPAEEDWLKLTAESNGFDEDWFRKQKTLVTQQLLLSEKMEADDLRIEYARY